MRTRAGQATGPAAKVKSSNPNVEISIKPQGPRTGHPDRRVAPPAEANRSGSYSSGRLEKTNHSGHREPRRSMAKKPVNPRTSANRSDSDGSSKPVWFGGLLPIHPMPLHEANGEPPHDEASIRWPHPPWPPVGSVVKIKTYE